MQNENKIPPSARNCKNFGQFIHSSAFQRPKVCGETGFGQICLMRKCCCYRSYLLAEKFRRTKPRGTDGLVNPFGEGENVVNTSSIFK